jgi:hypothetical protein
MELSPSWKAASCAATQELPRISLNSKVHCRVHKSPPLVSILIQIDPLHTIPCYLYKINLTLSTHLRLGLPSGFFSSTFPTNILYAFLFSPIRATCVAHLNLFDLIILIMFGEECFRSKYSPHYPVLKHPESKYSLLEAKLQIFIGAARNVDTWPPSHSCPSPPEEAARTHIE